ncbi:MAG: PIN domain-containing protein [Thermodesulfovibrionales bacterium]
MILPQNKVFCDTSFFYASLVPDDTNYDRAEDLLEYCKENAVVLYTTWDIISETVTLLRYRSSFKTALEFLDEIKPALYIVHYDDSVRTSAEDVFRKLSRDKKISLCDAVSFVVITHVLDNIPCLSFDRDFKTLGLTVYP